MQVETQISFGERLILELKKNDCSEKAINTVRAFEKKDWQDKAKFRAKNSGVLSFGKYKGKNIRDVYKLDPGYCAWMHEKSQKFLSQDIKDVLIELLK
jgi:hypothetical protein